MSVTKDAMTTIEYSFENVLNFRDVGGNINRLAGRELLVQGLLFRSARPDDATISDRKALKEQCGIKTVMDLRTKSEHLKQARKRETDLKVPSILKSNAALAESTKIPGMSYQEVNINGKGFEKTLVKKLKVWSFIKLVFLMIFGYRMKAISILGREVMTPRGLIGLGYDTLDSCGAEIAEALKYFASREHYPILLHCTQGKDRTGLITALLLFLLEIPLSAIAEDYRMSAKKLEPEREVRLIELKEMGFSEAFADCPKDFIESIYKHLDTKYGGIMEYLETIGIEEAKQMEIVDILHGRPQASVTILAKAPPISN